MPWQQLSIARKTNADGEAYYIRQDDYLGLNVYALGASVFEGNTTTPEKLGDAFFEFTTFKNFYNAQTRKNSFEIWVAAINRDKWFNDHIREPFRQEGLELMISIRYSNGPCVAAPDAPSIKAQVSANEP